MTTTTPARLADPEHDSLVDIVDVDRHQLTDCGDWARLGSAMARDLIAHGVARVPGFLRPEAVDIIAAEFGASARYAPIVTDRRSVYGRASRPGEPEALSDWVAGHITRDMIPPYSPAHRLYVAQVFKHLVAHCVGLERVYEYADPLAGLVATVLPPGGCYGWHYDTSRFVVTIGITEAEHGGHLEYVQDLRRPGDENLGGLERVVSGADASAIRSVGSRPGDLVVFLGRYSLHRVTEVTGAATRFTLVLAYADRAGVIGPVDRTRRVYGRVTEAHLLAGKNSTGNDGLIL